MIIETGIMQVSADDTVDQVRQRLNEEYEADEDGVAWLVVALEPPWQFSIVEAHLLTEVIDPADWDKPLKETELANHWNRSDAVPKAILEADEERAARMAINNPPNEMLVVLDVVGVSTEGEQPGPCYTRCPVCGCRQLAAGNNVWVYCRCKGHHYQAKCGG
jgi:hypothetical protein